MPLTPAEEAKKFWLQPGFKMEPVLTDPDIQEPAQIAFDGNGRMFVVEIRGYMQDADATGELAPVGRISVHEDRDNDGIYEKHHVFVDNLVFPRFVMPIRPERDSDEGIERGRGLEVHRHERRRRRRQEGAVRHRARPAAERRAPGERLHLGDGQLDLQHVQPVPRPLDAERRAPGTHRIERRPVGRHAGQRRQDVVPGGRERHARATSSSRSNTATSTIPNSSSRI